MYLEVNGERIYAATGGKPWHKPDATQPVVVFLHGSGLDHRSWMLQTRWFAFHGFSVVAPDFPAHSLSAGEPLTSIEAMADWLWELLDNLGVTQCSLVGHSQGGLVALAAAANPKQAERVVSISLLGSAAAIPVNPQLLELAQTNVPAAVNAMLSWGFGTALQFGLSPVPGQAPIATGWQIMCQNPLAADLEACQHYEKGLQAAASIHAPAQLILAQQDRMTPVKAGRALAKALAGEVDCIELANVGHMLPMEAPALCLQHLRQFISQCWQDKTASAESKTGEAHV